MEATSLHLPESPVKEIFSCPSCSKVHVKFWDEKSNKTYTSNEWSYIIDQGSQALEQIKAKFKEDPKIF